ncbi:hypothetical protein SDC9_80851 [bioreactor metagenome]|uniref:Uncharacterized protein n=1 Tax=bioreactor metagenome TaxID=1076179 RepID=A0A644Z138_9ZZZZ
MACTSVNTSRTAMVTPTPTNPPPAVMPMRRMVDVVVSEILSFASSLTDSVSLLMFSIVLDCEPALAETLIVPFGALRTAPLSTSALTLENSTDIARPTPTPAYPPPPREPAIMFAFSRSLEVISIPLPFAVSCEEAYTTAEVESLRLPMREELTDELLTVLL